MFGVIPSTAAVDRELVKRRGFNAYVELAARHVTGVEDFVPGKHIEVCAKNAEDLYRGVVSALLVNLPPGVMKSVLMSVLLPTWIWTEDPSYVFMCASYEQSVASDLAGKARDLMLTKWWRDRWGDIVVGGEDGAVSEYWTTHNGFRLSTSVQQGRGIGRHCNMYIVDDPTKTQAIDEGKGAILKKTRDWFKRTVLTRGKIGKAMRVLVTMQRLHEDDLSGVVAKAFGSSKRFRHIKFAWKYEPQIACDQDWRTVPGEVLWPEAAALGKQEEIDRIVAEEGGETGTTFRSQYQQDPGTGDDRFFPDWSFLDFADAPPLNRTLSAIIVDPTFTDAERSDLMAIDVVGYYEGHWYCYYSEAVRRDFKSALDAILRIRSLWPTHNVLVEAAANGHAILNTLEGLIPGLVPVKPVGSKKARAKAASYYFKALRVHFDKKAQWFAEKARAMIRFPGAEHDDTVDTIVYGILWLATMYLPGLTFSDAMAAIRENRDDGKPVTELPGVAGQMAGFAQQKEQRARETKAALGLNVRPVLPFGGALSIEAYE